MICHLMGEPQEERLVWLANEQAIMSPEWSIHAAGGSGAGASFERAARAHLPHVPARAQGHPHDAGRRRHGAEEKGRRHAGTVCARYAHPQPRALPRQESAGKP